MKTRLTITLPPDLLKTIDTLVDKKTIRNRSHAIEHLVRESLGSNITTAVILAGGSTKSEKNALLKKVAHKYLFHHQLEHLKKYGINQVIVCLSDFDRELEELLGDGSAQGVNVEYSFEKQMLGTAGTLRKAGHLFKNQQTVVVIHGDVLTTIALDELINFHQAEDAAVTLAVKPRIGKKELGQVYLQGNRVINFSKNGIESEISIINTGVYIISREVIDSISTRTPSMLEIDVFPKLAKAGKLRAFIFQGIWYDISTEDQYQSAQKKWPS